MAVELRCPDCRAKLRLKSAPEAGTEVECPKCGTVFPAPEPEADEDEAPKKKKKATAEDEEAAAREDAVKELKKAKGKDGSEEKGEKKKGKKVAAAAGAAPAGPRKRRAKKVETSKAALIGVIAAAVLMVLSMGGMLIWYFTRTSKAVEMFYYVPEDAQAAEGMNIGHAQKYPEFYKQAKLQDNSDVKVAGDAIAKAADLGEVDGMADYFVRAVSSSNGWAIVYRTKSPFDDSSLAKIPGAEKKSLGGRSYYAAPLLPGNGRGRVFAPTDRLVVVCPDSIKDATFQKMLNGHADSKDKTLGVRMGALGNRVTRGTFWTLAVFDQELKVPTAPPAAKEGQGGPEDSGTQLLRTAVETLNGAQGAGSKASLGSREVRFEVVVWYKDGSKASEVAKKWKESELGKGDEGNPPKWFKDFTQSLGDRKVAAQFLSNLGFGSSGELFYARTSVETVDLQQSARTALGKMTGQEQKGGGNPGQGGGPPGGPPGPPGGPKGPPGMPRRRAWGRR